MIDSTFYKKYMSDRKLWGYITEIEMLKKLYIPGWKKTENGLKECYPSDHAYEIIRVMDMRDKYIKEEYPELILED